MSISSPRHLFRLDPRRRRNLRVIKEGGREKEGGGGEMRNEKRGKES
jgi:hypothetical protein